MRNFMTVSELINAVKNNEVKVCLNNFDATSEETVMQNYWINESVDKVKNLVIDGVSEVSVFFTTRGHYDDVYNEDTKSFDRVLKYRYVENSELHVLLHYIPTDEYYTVITNRQGKQELYNWREVYVDPRGFDFTDDKPNLIGKVTEKKLRDWVEYCQRRRIAGDAFRKLRNERIAETMDAVKKSGLKYTKTITGSYLIYNGIYIMELSFALDGSKSTHVTLDPCASRPDFDRFMTEKF